MKLLFLILKYSGITTIIRELFQRNCVTILLYHDISPQNATVHFKYLQKKYSLISLQTLIHAYKTSSFDKLPKKALVITFDDGYKGNYDLLPVLQESGIPVTVFLCSGIVGTNRHYWFKHVTDGNEFQKLTKISDIERKNILRINGFSEDTEFEKRMALSDSEILELSKYVDFQSHTVFHPCLPACSDETADWEISLSKKDLEKRFDFYVNVLSYPNGDYSDRELEFLSKSGYEAGITCDLWFNYAKTNIFKLRRLDCRDDAPLIELESKVTGIYLFLKRLIRGRQFGYSNLPAK